jgi:hypothetical protein
MFERKTLEEARTPLERRRALEHEAALAHVERRRVAALEETRAQSRKNREAAAVSIRRSFERRREANAKTRTAAYEWECDPEAFTQMRNRCVREDEDADARERPAEALTRGARLNIQRPKVIGPCAFVPVSSSDFSALVARRAFTDEREAYETHEEALADVERKLGGVSACTYARYFKDFAASHRETERAAGRRLNAHTARSVLKTREHADDTARQMEEMDAFETKLAYFHANDLRQRLVDRGWLAEASASRGVSGATTLAEAAKGDRPTRLGTATNDNGNYVSRSEE